MGIVKGGATFTRGYHFNESGVENSEWARATAGAVTKQTQFVGSKLSYII